MVFIICLGVVWGLCEFTVVVGVGERIEGMLIDVGLLINSGWYIII